MLQLPPIEKINPFEKDETGAFFKEYPTHRALRRECGMQKNANIYVALKQKKMHFP